MNQRDKYEHTQKSILGGGGRRKEEGGGRRRKEEKDGPLIRLAL